MKKILSVLTCLTIVIVMSAQEKKLLRGFDGGMMIHTGYLQGNLEPIGYDFIVSKPMHLTLKVDYLCALSESKLLPHGPRVYFGFLFYH